jgi:hypothetical protein
MLKILSVLTLIFFPTNLFAADSLNVRVWQAMTTDQNWNDGEKVRVGKLIIHSPNEIEFEVNEMRFVHKVRLSGPKFEYDNEYGEGWVEFAVTDGKITSGMIVQKAKMGKRETVSHTFIVE